MKNVNYLDYKSPISKKHLEGDMIGYALFKSGHVKEDLTEIDPECMYCMLNKGPLKDIAKIHGKKGEYFISQIFYSKYGNFLGDEQDFFTIY